MNDQQKTVLKSVSNVELVFIRNCSSLGIITNGQMHIVMSMAQTFLAFASSTVMMSNQTLKCNNGHLQGDLNDRRCLRILSR
jgi:hypothetical protein